ncbi:MAG TPA: phosphoadenosine phosphosulfate reductase family protein [Caproicibacter sp.]|nr:phosphoadenosine phosphosulfate reductase family protein [Caproicibacter sp.]
MDLEQTAIKRLQYAADISAQYYNAPLIVTYSGGKDSEVLLELARRAEIDFEVQHNHTTADAPETVRHVRETFKRLELEGIPCTINYPFYKGQRVSMWTLIPQKLMPPTRLARYCCEVLKEHGGKNRCITTGVRWDESTKRAKNQDFITPNKKDKEGNWIGFSDNEESRREFEACPIKGKTTINPIIDWKNSDIWEFARIEKLNMNPLYECGFDRVGCIGCPLAGDKRYFEFHTYPCYEQHYRRAFDRLAAARKAAGKTNEGQWQTGEGIFRWWMEDKNLDGQLKFGDTP